MHTATVTTSCVKIKTKISLVAHNPFRFDFFLLLKRLRIGIWKKTRDFSIGGKKPSKINFADIGNQVVFINIIKYFQQNLRKLARSLTDRENLLFEQNVKNSSEWMTIFLKNVSRAQKKTKRNDSI